CKKILPIDANTVKTTFNSKAAIRVYNPAFSLNVVKASPKLPNDQCRASVITGKKALGKSAVIRNRARRRIISCARLCFPQHATPGHDYLFFAQPEAVTMPWSTLMGHMQKTLEQVARRFQAKQK
ncbi:hypothetical protein INT43_006022, partial [Umbelopsis isabellina]